MHPITKQMTIHYIRCFFDRSILIRLLLPVKCVKIAAASIQFPVKDNPVSVYLKLYCTGNLPLADVRKLEWQTALTFAPSSSSGDLYHSVTTIGV